VSGIVLIVLIFLIAAGALGAVAFFTYQRKLRRAKAIERGLKMVPVLIHLPPPSSDTEAGNRDVREVMREKTSQAEVLYNLIAGTATEGFKSSFYGQRHIALELIAIDGIVHFFVAVPVALVSTVTKAVQTAYPGARLEEVEDHNIFNQEGRLAATLGGEMVLRAESAYPIATYAKLERDPMEALLTSISALEKKDGVAVQIMLRPAHASWTKRSIAIADAKRKNRGEGLSFSAMDLAKAAIKAPAARREEERARMGGGQEVSNLELQEVEAIEEKTKHPAFEVLIRAIVSTGSVARSQQLLRDIATAFALFETPGMNGFKFLPALDVQGLVTAFIFRFFPPELKSNILNSSELATLFHLPDAQFTPSTSVERQQSKQVDGPVQLPAQGLLFGHNEFRGVRKEIRLSPEDRRRHTYILGQTGTGKSTMLENLAVQDMLAGNGFAFIDPHGDSAEKLLSLVPKERAEDVVYFNPADTQYPLGLNLFEFTDPSQKDFIVQETINMLYKLYDPGHTGIIGPRYEHWYRNAALTLMADPNGATFIEIPKVFTDTEYLKLKFKHLKDPTVIDFWTKEMGQTSDYHKSEMLGWFVSKFGAFQNNEMMRNIIGQTKSAFNLREIMDHKKILIVNLSKGRVGELNSQLLGMIFVIKFQAAAMSRADMPEAERSDFALYVDEFQNFSTDSFASILSEARKYRLNLIVANQFIGQLTDEIRDAVFGNIGSIVAHRMGPEDAEFMVKQFAPVFDVGDLVNIPNYHSVMRLMIGGLPSQPFTLRDSAPITGANAELGMAIKQLSAAKFGRTKAAVEADIIDRMSGHGAVAAPAAPAAVGAPAVVGTPAAAPVAVGAPGVPAAPAVTAAPVAAVTASVAVAAPALGATPAAAPAPSAVPAVTTAPAAPAPVPAPVAPTPALAMEPIAPAPVSAGVMEAAVPGAVAPFVPASAPPLSGMATTPPPIGAPPVGVAPIGAPPVDLPSAAATPDLASFEPAMAMPAPVLAGVATMNSAGQMMTPVGNIIPEDNLEAEADRMTAAGGFNQMGMPLPKASVPAGPLADPQLATTPPPIGAPPVDTLPIGIGAPPIEAGAVDPYGPSAMAPAMSAVGSAMGGAAGPAMIAPPPIGAPPVDLPGVDAPVTSPLPSPAAKVPGAPMGEAGILSLRDITGGRPPRPRVVDPMAIPIMEPGAEPPMAVMGAAPMVSGAPIPRRPPGVPLGAGQALPDDPYANIDILGDLTPPAGPAMAPMEGRPFVAAAPPPVVGKPLPDDPYANIDILGAVPMPAGGQEVLAAPAPEVAAEPVLPEGPMMPGRPMQPSVVPVASADQYEPEAAYVSEAAPQSELSTREAMDQYALSRQEAMEPTPPVRPLRPEVASPAEVMEPLLQPEPVAEQPEPMYVSPRRRIAPAPRVEPSAAVARPVRPPRTWPSVSLETNPMAASESLVAPGRFALSPQPSALASPMPEVMAEAAPQPTYEPTAEELIHFVDPNAAAVLQRPDVPETIPADGELSLAGLPEGVQLINPAGAVPTALANANPNATARTLATATPVAPPPAAPVAVGPSVPSLAVPLEKMATTPPPIGAAPVNLAPLSAPASAPAQPAAPPPVAEPQEARIAQAAEAAPLPAPNATLVEALQKASVPPVPAEVKPAVAENPLDKLESVADMLEDHKVAVQAGSPAQAEATSAAAAPSPAEAAKAPATSAGAQPEAKPVAGAAAAEKVAAQAEAPTIKPLRTEVPAAGAPAKALSAAEKIEKAEREIDDLLSVSLIHPESSTGSHHRLPEPAAPLEDETGVDLELNARRAAPPQAPVGTPAHMMAQHHGLKVIQPLEPIVPPREQFAKELAAMQAAGQPVLASAQQPAGAKSAPAAKSKDERSGHKLFFRGKDKPEPAKPAPVPTKPAPATSQAVAPAAPAPAAAAPQPQPAPVAPAPAPVPQPVFEAFDELPQAESLAAGDVAKARSERQVHEQMAMQAPTPAAPALVPAPTPAAATAEAVSAAAAAAAPAKAAPAPVAAKPASEKAEAMAGKKNKRKRLADEKPAEHIESTEEAEHNKPTAAGAEAGTLTGTLILPTGEKPKPEPVQPKTEKPKKLAPGEVYVDENGNVMIGE
jgi:hypothetical protein